MGLSQALFSAISGLTNHQRAMDNIGNNLANVNTVSYKKGVFQFRTLIEQSLRGGTEADSNSSRGAINPIYVGLGTQTGSINKNFTQGSMDVTGNMRDMAIEGNGYFVLRNGNSNVFTRDGTFYLGSDGSLLGGDGLQVQGIVADTVGTINTSDPVADLSIPIGQTGAAVETTEVAFSGNVDSNNEVATGLRLAANTPTTPDSGALAPYMGTWTYTGANYAAQSTFYTSLDEATQTLNVYSNAARTVLVGTSGAGAFVNGVASTINIATAGYELSATYSGAALGAGSVTNGEIYPNYNADISSYLGITNSATAGTGTADNTWNALTLASNGYINGGTVWTTSPLAQPAGGATLAAAGTGTRLEDLYYLSGTTWVRPFEGIDTVSTSKTVTVSFSKGGRKHTAEFTYDPNVNSVTLEDMMRYLCGNVDKVADVSSIADIQSSSNTSLTGGAMGTIQTAGKVSRAITDGDYAFDVPPETGGAFSRTDYDDLVDYNDGNPPAVSSKMSVVSNLGSENAITDIEVSYNNVKYSDLFRQDSQYSQEQGGSATTNIVVYDSLGNPKNATVQMTLVARDTNFSTWRWIADSEDDTDADWQVNAGNTIDSSVNVGTGLIRFDSEGNFVKGVELSESAGISITLESQGVNDKIQLDLTEGLSPDATQDLDFSFMTQVATDNDFNLKEQNGTAPGTLDSFTVDPDGVIQGVYSNGVIRALGRLVLALIPNEAGMVPSGSNLYYEGPSSGEPRISVANIGGRGQIRAGQLESSNVDLSEEFTKMITVQRGFQANSRVVTTSDEMLVELVNMKR